MTDSSVHMALFTYSGDLDSHNMLEKGSRENVRNSRAINGVRMKGPLGSVRHQAVVFKKNWQLLLLCLPALTAYILFQYVPMAGVVLAFKNYKYNLGIFGSEWAGLKNFKYLLSSPDLWRITRNTVGYSLAFLVVGLFLEIGVALLLFEIDHRRSLKFYQTCMQFPRFMSWVIVGFITYALFNPSYGVLNQLLSALGLERVDVYSNVSSWPIILIVCNAWKGVGAGSIMYYAALMGIDHSLYEAAAIDGATRWQQTRYISIPSLVSIATIMAILQIGNIFTADFGLFYQIPRNIGLLYPTTDIVNTYVFRSLQGGRYTAGAATGLLQSVLGLIMVLLANGIVKKIAPENAMF